MDARLATAGITEMSERAATACARKHAYRADPHGYAQRGRTERQHRRVTPRPRPDTMALLGGYLPVEQGVACLAALAKHADQRVAAGDGRTRDPIMADTLVERLTGQSSAADVPLEPELLVPLEALTDPSSTRSAELVGISSRPLELALEIISTSQGRISWRRLFQHPGDTSWVATPPAAGSTAGWPS